MSIFFMPSEFAPPGGKPRVTKKQIQEMQENYKKASELLEDTTAEEAQEKAILDELFDAEFDAVFEEAQKVGVYIGRFQPLHKGHENVLKQMNDDNDKVLIFIGTGGDEEKNPFSYEECETFFSEYSSADFLIQRIHDMPNDMDWVKNLSQIIDAHTIANSEIHFYGGDLENDYAIKVVRQYIGEYLESPVSYKEVSREQLLIPVNGEQIALSASMCRAVIQKGEWDILQQLVSMKNIEIIKKNYD